MRKLSARARWGVPAGAITAVGVVIAVSAAASASEPSLPARTAVQLLTEIQQAAAKPLSPLTATVQETANLGLPALPQVGALGGQSGPAAMPNPLAGTSTVNVWYLNPQHVRLADQAPLGESDLRLDGRQLWLWNSKDQTATHVLLPAAMPRGGGKLAAPEAGPEIGSPAAAARQLLAALGPSTIVRVGPNATVAGRAAYQLMLAPRAAGSLVSQVLIAVDASSHLPLRVQVFARGSSDPAFQLGFTSLTFGKPAASNFTFTPPPGAKVKTVTVPAKLPVGLAKGGPAGLGALGLGLGSTGQVGNAATPAPPPLPPALAKRIRADFLAHLPKNLTKAQRAAAIKMFERSISARERGTGGRYFTGPVAGLSGFGPGTLAGLGAGAPKVLGSGWTTVIATPASPAVAAAVRQLLTAKAIRAPAGQAFGGIQSSAQASAGQPAVFQRTPVPVGPGLAVLRALLRASTPVKGSWGSGRLLRTTLLTVLITSKGQILAGAVTPAVLYSDAATQSR